MIGALDTDTRNYRSARLDLLRAEAALRDQAETVAEMRRNLAEPTPVENYRFETGPDNLSADGPITETPLSGLFSADDRTLVIYHFMLGGAQTTACPMCAMWMDGFNALVSHLSQRIDLRLSSLAPLTEFRAFARTRGWTQIRLVSSAPSSITRDFGIETEDGGLLPAISVFRLSNGKPMRTYAGSAFMGKLGFRGLDLLSPVWNVLDLTPEGRGDWTPKLAYP